MNGVRRFLGGSTPSNSPTPPQSVPSPPTIAPLVISSGKPVWPPPESPAQSQPNSPYDSPKTTTAALFLRKDKQKPVPPTPSEDRDVGNTSSHSGRSGSVVSVVNSPTRSGTSSARLPIRLSQSSPGAGPSSPRVPPPSSQPRTSTTSSSQSPDWKRASGLLNTKDELLMSLLSSEALVDSRECEILSSEETEDLKKEQQVLASRLGAMSKKLSLETKIRDAAVSLTKVNAAHKKVSKQSDEQLEVANRRVDTAQKELWRVSERANEVQRKLLEHRAGVLSFSVRNMERKLSPSNGVSDADGSGYSTPNRSSQMSPTPSSVTSVSTSSKARFDGAHLFAGHADSLVPVMLRKSGDFATLEEKLKAATKALEAANKKQAEMARDLSLLRLEREEVETTMGMELQNAEETISALEKELPRLEGLDTQLQDLLEEKIVWERDKAEREKQIETLERRLEILEERSGEATEMEQILERKDEEIRNLEAQWKEDRERWEEEKAGLGSGPSAELDEGVSALRTMIQTHQIYSRNSSLQGMLAALGTHLGSISSKMDLHTRDQEEWQATRKKLEQDLQNGLDKREVLYRDVEDARQEREVARNQVRLLEARIRDEPGLSSLRSPISPIVDLSGDVSGIISVLQPIWAILPSPEARASKLGGSQRNFRTGSPTNSPGSPKPQLASLSEMDVRSLKTLYDSRSLPQSPNNMASFSIEAFAARVQALIADDRSLIERLIRFAQAHDLLKKNAERAQKLAQESNNALETYQKQVRTLEERNMTLIAKQAALQEEVQQLQDSVDRIQAEKLEVETHAAEQAETCRELTEANNTLSARALTLAEEAASAPEMIKRQLEAQLAECKTSLQRAQAEVTAIRTSEQSQQSVLLDELNSMQTENSNLRAQLRAVKK